MLLLFWLNLHRLHSGLFSCRRYGFSKQAKQEKVNRKSSASGLPQGGSAVTEVTEEEELQEAEEVSRSDAAVLTEHV